jgi:hypothetical protein
MDTKNFENDIPESLATAAHSGTSHVPEKRGRQERSSYAQSLRQDYELFRQQAEQGGTLELLEAEFARYREAMGRHTREYLDRRSRCLSTLITGGSNFPTAGNRKRNDSADKKMDELIDFQKRARAAILRTLRPDLQPIRSSDSDALERLRAELAQLEADQRVMKAVNAAIRKHRKGGRESQVAALMALGMGISAGRADELLTPNSFGDLGFPDYRLRNRNASIRRIQARIKAVSHTQAAPVIEAQGTAARLEDDPPANRVRLFFPAKPAPGVITTLKANAFRWTPSLGAWQAFRNPESLRVAREIAGIS